MNKELALEYLKHCDEQVVCLAYMYAKNYCADGVDVTKLLNAIENSKAQKMAYIRGFRDGVKRLDESRNPAKDVHSPSLPIKEAIY